MSVMIGKSRKGNPIGNPNLENTRISILNNEKNLKNIENEDAKSNKILDRLFNAVGSDVKKLRRFGRNVYLENEKNEINICKNIDHFIRNVDNENFASTENNSNDYELVEKHVLEKLIAENNDLLSSIQKLQGKIDEIKKFNFKTTSEETFLKHAVETNKKSENNLKPKTLNVEDELKKGKNANKTLKNVLTSEKIQNDNMLQALRTLLSEIDSDVIDDFDEILKKYDNSYYLDKAKNMKDLKTIDELFAKVEQLEKEKFSKDIEIKNLKNSKPEKASFFKK